MPPQHTKDCQGQVCARCEQWTATSNVHKASEAGHALPVKMLGSGTLRDSGSSNFTVGCSTKVFGER